LQCGGLPLSSRRGAGVRSKPELANWYKLSERFYFKATGSLVPRDDRSYSVSKFSYFFI